MWMGLVKAYGVFAGCKPRQYVFLLFFVIWLIVDIEHGQRERTGAAQALSLTVPFYCFVSYSD